MIHSKTILARLISSILGQNPVNTAFSDGSPGFHFTIEEAIKANEAALGPELVVNGDFSDGATGWTSGASPTLADISGGVVVLTRSADSSVNRGIRNATLLASGKNYVLCFDVVSGSGSLLINESMTTPVSSGQKYKALVTPSSAVAVSLRAYAGVTATLDNISVKEIDLSKCQIFQDSAGTIPVVAMEQPIGLILDSSRGLVRGPELVVNGDFSAGSAGWGLFNGWAVSGGVVSAVSGNSGDAVYRSDAALIPGRWYQVSYEILAISAGAISSKLSGVNGTQRSTVGVHTDILLATINTPYVGFRVHGTTTATVDNISVKELPGNHFYQADPTKRPTVTRRVNVIPQSTNLLSAGWLLSNLGVSAGVMTPVNPSAFASYARASVALVDSASYIWTIKFKQTDIAHAYLYFRNKASTNSYVSVNLSTGALYGASNLTTYSSVMGSDGTITVSLTIPTSDTGPTNPFAQIQITKVDGNLSVDPTDVIEFVSSDLRLAAHASGTITAYQAVRSATDYDEVGFPAGAKFNGLNTFLESAAIDMTATDEVTVVSSLVKSSDASSAIVAEFSGSTSLTERSFHLAAPALSGERKFQVASRGSSVERNAATTSTDYSAPYKGVATAAAKIGSDRIVLRLNQSQISVDAADQGTGNYGNHKMYVGMRGGTSLSFSGVLYGLTVVGKLQTDSRLAALEAKHRNIGKL